MSTFISCLAFLFAVDSSFVEHTSSSKLFTISIPDVWEVRAKKKYSEIYFKDDAYLGTFGIDVRPFLALADAKKEYFDLLKEYENARLEKINDVPVVICSGEIEEGMIEYNWIFYYNKYEVWCQYQVMAGTDHDAELEVVRKAVGSIRFFEID